MTRTAPKMVVTLSGNTQISTAQYKFGSSSIHLDGTGDYITVTDNGNFDFGTNDFTIEWWQRLDSLDRFAIDFRGGASASNKILLYSYQYDGSADDLYLYTNANRISATNSDLTANQWQHIALVRSSNTTKLYINGTQQGSSYTDNNNYNHNEMRIWHNSIGAENYTPAGYIDEYRVSDSARYTSNFTPPSARFEDDANTVFHLQGIGVNQSTDIDDTSPPYFEAGYFVAGYFEGSLSAATTHEGAATLSCSFTLSTEQTSNYFVPGYFEDGYFEGSITLAQTHEGAASLSASFTHTTSGTRVKLLNEGLTASFTQSSQGARTRSTAITMTSSFGVSEAQPTRIKQLSATISSALTATMTVSALKNHTAVLSSSVSFTATAVKNASDTVALANIIALSLQGDRTRTTASTLTSSFSHTTQAQKTTDTSSSQSAQSTQTTSGTRIRFGASTLTGTFSMSVSTALVFEASFTTSSIGGSTGLDAVASLTTTITKTAGASATLAGAFTPSLTAGVTRVGEITMTSSITVSCAGAKIRTFASTISAQSTISATGRIAQYFFKFKPSVRNTTSTPQQFAPNVSFNGAMDFTSGQAQSFVNLINNVDFANFPDDNTAINNILNGPGTADFTLEFFVDPDNSNINFGTSDPVLGFYSTDPFRMQRNGSNWDITVRATDGTEYDFSLQSGYSVFNRHYAIQRSGNLLQIYSDGFFLNGKEANVSGKSFRLNGLRFNGQGIYKADEVRYSLKARYSNANSGSTLDYTVPSAPVPNDAGTIFSFHFDDNIADCRLEDATADFSVSASLNLEFIVDASSTQTANTTLSCNAGVLLESDADLSSAVTQSTTAVKTTDTSVDFDAINTLLGAVAKIGDFLMAFDVAFGKSFTVQKTTDITKTLSSAFTQTAEGIKNIDEVVNLSSDITQSTQGDRIRFGTSTQAVTASLSCDAVETDDFSASISVTASLDCETSPLRSTGAELSSTFTANITAVKTTDVSGTFAGTFTQTTNGQAGLFSDAELDVTASLSLTPSVTRTFTVDFDAINTQITVAARTAAFFINHDLVASMTTVNSRQRNTSATLDSEASMSTTVFNIKPLSANITATATLTANGVTQAESESAMTSDFGQSTTAVKTVSVQANLQSEKTFALTALVARGGDIDLISTTSVQASADRIRNTSATKSAVISISVNAGKKVDVAASFTTTVTMSTDVIVIHTTDIVYVIPAETREFSIKTETRDITIDAEDREHKVLRLI